MKLNWPLRILLALGALSLPITYYVPTWRIELSAPQYPEGLEMTIWLDHLTGNVESINNLNHYIGMRRIEADMFPEFQVLPYVVGALTVLGLLAAAVGRRWLAAGWLGAMGLFLLAAMVDFYRWGYDYGHNLDPQAAIRIDGMTYQPPLIGYKQLLNFEALSMPGTGAWIMAGVTLLIAVVLFLSRKAASRVRPAVAVAAQSAASLVVEQR